MTRSVDGDFDQLCTYLREYSLSGLSSDSTRKPLIKKAHKLYFSTLHLWAQCQHILKYQELVLYGVEINSDSELLFFFREAISDVGNGYFCCLHGAYKPAHMALRSSVENFLRFIAGGFENNALITPNVSDLFQTAKQTAPFLGERSKQYSELRGSYKELCKFTHSTSLEHMSGVHALSHFPSFDDNDFRSWNKHATSICVAMAVTLCLADHEIYLKSHYKIREVLDILLPTTATLEILNRSSSTQA